MNVPKKAEPGDCFRLEEGHLCQHLEGEAIRLGVVQIDNCGGERKQVAGGSPLFSLEAGYLVRLSQE